MLLFLVSIYTAQQAQERNAEFFQSLSVLFMSFLDLLISRSVFFLQLKKSTLFELLSQAFWSNVNYRINPITAFLVPTGYPHPHHCFSPQSVQEWINNTFLPWSDWASGDMMDPQPPHLGFFHFSSTSGSVAITHSPLPRGYGPDFNQNIRVSTRRTLETSGYERLPTLRRVTGRNSICAEEALLQRQGE
ncbi:hypothetical protein Cgig2_028402 [Carnegiea gigantea]|uniref:Uncharacterized protein n=1 Tax=Carnegiea gigantea TaxID=171969 RepID=A0A9Q1K2F1_9CARY|nr:hypothetical protein Cgig2_028402 [Carnegiea gigantea]